MAGREPDDLAAGKREPGVCGVFGCSGPSHGPGHPVRAVPLAAVIPSRVPGRGRGAWGGSASEEAVRRGQSDGRPRRRCGGGADSWRPRAWPLARGKLFMPPAPAGSRAAGRRPGQAADLPVAHAVEDQGEQPAGGGDLGDVAGFLPAAGDDGVLDGADHASRAGPAGWPRSAPSAAAAIPAW